MKNKKILFMIHDMNIGGAEVGLVDVMNELIKSNNVDLVLLRKRGPLLERLDPRIHVFSIMQDERFTIYNKFIRFCYFAGGRFTRYAYKKTIKDSYDVEIAYIEGYPAVFIASSPNKHSVKIASIRVGLYKHSMKILSFSYGRRLLKRAYKKVDAIHCVSDQTKKEFLDLYPDCANKTQTIYTYFNVENIRKKAAVGGSPFTNKGNVFLAVGRFAPQKGYERLIEAYSKINSEYEETSLHILGDNDTEYGKYIKELILKKGLADKVILHGIVDNPYPHMKYCDILVSSSFYEGYPRVINEALSLGKLCVGTDVTGTREALKNGKLGILAQDSADGLYSCMKKYLDNPEKVFATYSPELSTYDGNKIHFFNRLANLCEKKKSIGIFLPKLTIGGMEKALINLLKYSPLTEHYRVTLNIVYKGKINLCDQLPPNVNLRAACRGDWNFWGKIVAAINLLWRYLHTHKYDVSFCYSHHHPILALLARMASENNVLFFHSNIVKSLSLTKAGKLVKRLKATEFSKIICVSNDVKEAVWLLTGRQDLFTINNLIDGDAILAKSKETISDYTFGQRIVFVNVSRHEEKPKALSRLFTACEKLNSDGFEYDVLLIGDGLDHETYLHTVEKMRLDNIYFLGRKMNPYPYMARSSALVLCSRYEGYPVVFLESMVLGLPIITTDVSDARQDIDGKYGIVVQNNDDSIYDGMRTFLTCGFSVADRFDYKSFNEKIFQNIYKIIEKGDHNR